MLLHQVAGGTSSRARARTSPWVALLLQTTLTLGLFGVALMARFISSLQGEPGSCSHPCSYRVQL